MPTGRASGLVAELGVMLRTILPVQVARCPPWSRLVIEMPAAAPSTMLSAITEPENPNSE